ncbi:hypothetical protein KVT40_005844 [Elsinoe batatas]|uniref:Altered inheritance of mitochondria protein 21 n=1 Tax=Elsinoe batatas TaxID=2601811 RepID=A0A8K0KZK3_9PEZI|nr:hypothetical protein KVT40_005844 [Elsinoe batatas]
MSTAAPTIPPRPARSGQGNLGQDIPQIPPRPHRRSDRSVSPNREAFTRSPLNERPIGQVPPVFEHHRAPSNSELPIRPPSVQLPSIGHEGDEYANFEDLQRTTSHGSGPSEQTRNVAADLPMHQPTASVPQSTAKSRIQGVTRTNSDQANALSKTFSHEEGHSEKHSLRAKASFNRSNPNLHHSRPGSIHEPEHVHGIPEIGLQVPMYPNAGDVQAPSPAQSAPPHSAGIGFFNDGSRNHHRRRSSRQEFGPPGSYGMHGHGLEPRDQFEKAWYQRHPEELAKERNHHYDPGHPRSEWALSSDDLNKLVHSKRTGNGPVASPNVATPDEQIGYLASEQYASRQHSPKPTPLGQSAKRPSSSSQTHAASPLHKSSFPFNEAKDHGAVESDDEDENTIRIQAPERRTSRLGGGGYDHSTEDLGIQRGNSNEEEREYDVPILAADEIAKYPGGEFQQPAVDPDERGYDSDHHHSHYASHRRPSSRDKDSSRPTSMHGEPLSRLLSQDRHDGSGVGTPLEEIQEYEPLFPDDDDKVEKKPIHKSRPDLARHHFPSQDIWEDNPESLGLTATVSTPDLPPEPKQEDIKPEAVFEHPDVEAKRKNGPLPTDRAAFLPKETEKYADPRYKPGVLQDIPDRPHLAQRFPSQDIWEDNPDSLRLTTTVSSPQDDITSPTSPEETSRTIPSIPARPAKKPETSPTDRRAPTIPDRPKPSVPARPLPRSSNAVPSSPLAMQEGSARPKPAVPSRPAGKLAGIKASFMNDLNSRLQLGPPVAKKEEPKVEDKEPEPLADARKGRARGPARRKPAAATETEAPKDALSISTPRLIFSLDDEGSLAVYSSSYPKTEAETRSALPAEQVGAEGDLPDPTLDASTSESQNTIAEGLQEALADNDAKRDTPLDEVTDVPVPSTAAREEGGIGPAKSDKTATESLQSVLARDQERSAKESEGVNQSVQTGETEMRVKSPEGKEEKITAFVGGKAPEEGDVVVKDGETQV